MILDATRPSAPRARPEPLAAAATPPDPATMRRVLGQFASGVTVVTGLDGTEPVGFACQSFASVSLEPPLVLFCAGHGSASWPRIRRGGRFTVNVLAETQHELCERFGSRTGRKFDGLDWQPSRWGTPSLPGVLARVHCAIEAVHPAGDHDVVIGAVDELEWAADEAPMIFFRGAFGLVPAVPA